MKKYLMTGIAALALCVGFTSCSHDIETLSQEEINERNAQQMVLNYQKAFVATFGQPAANHQWGFINYSQARTRGTYDADHPGSYPDANLWADQGWKAPTELSPGQIARVKAYFQSNPHLTYVDPQYTDFFIQQVYKGNPATKGTISPEQYGFANGTTDTGSDHMDHLTVGLTQDGKALDHVYNFNYGRYSTLNTSDPNGTRRDNVQNYPGVTYLYPNNDGKTHQDHIMLVTQSNTKAVGFAESNASVQHNECCANASAQVIDAWAEKEENWVNGAPIGATVYDPQWERSFVGLDYEAQSPENAYYKSNGQKVEATLGVINNTGQAAWDGTQYLPWTDALKNQTLKEFFGLDYDVYFISDQTNGIVAVTSNYGGQGDLLIKRKGSEIGLNGLNANQEYDVFDLTKISNKLNMGYIPVWGKGYVEWVTNIGGRDYVFSDWIITLTKASQTVIVPEWDLRIIAEDLNATAQAGDTEDSDWDFNDVVLDVKFLEGTDQVKIRVTAAGATLPIRINGEDALEVHGLYGQPTNIMINTGAAAAGYPRQAYESNGVYPTAAIFERTISGVDASYGANIKIEVEKGAGNWIELEAKPGQPASKMGVLPDYIPCAERQDIRNKYSGFVAWVAKQSPTYWWRPVNQ